MSTVNLHIGTFKTGTSYLQTVLAHSKAELAEAGVLWPGRAWADQVTATRALLGNRPGRGEAWDRLIAEVDAWTGPEVIVSMESLSMASPRSVQRAAASLRRHRVRVILTARDIGRVLPAQWQESLQNGKSWSYPDYLHGVVSGAPGDRAYEHFWGKHDWAHVLRTWSEVGTDAELVLVTVPPSGAPRGLLWERFCEAVSLDPERYDSSRTVNESLGAASAEVIRHVSAALDSEETHKMTGRVLKKTLSKSILNSRKADEPTLVLPHHLESWAEQRSAELVADLKTVPAALIGDYEDLMPRFSGPRPNQTEDPATLPVDELLTAAGFGLAKLCEALAENGLAPRGFGPDNPSQRRAGRRKNQS